MTFGEEVIVGIGEVVRQLRSLVTFPESPGSIPITHMAVHNLL